MFKKFFGFLFSCIIFNSLFTIPIHAEGEFKTDVQVNYKVQENGLTRVNYQITLENLFSDLYATSYSLILANIKPENINVSDTSHNLKTEIKQEGDKVEIKTFFADVVVGKNKKREFNISYDDREIASRTGEVWEIAIPRLAGDSTFNFYTLSLNVPLSFGQEAYLSPDAVKSEVVGRERTYYFNKSAVTKTGITAGFGEFQVFNFKLIYHLENPLSKTAVIDIAVPPDTSLQKVYYESIDPKPTTITTDPDGNWLARYQLKPRERVDITAEGNVQIFSGPRAYPEPDQNALVNNLKSTDYWPSTDVKIQGLAQNLKTPKEIYDYVVNHLSYNLDRAKPNVARLGAVEALNNPQNAICMEYTDLFIALARAAGIPAREINGFAYTENPKIQPLSLVSDVLHAWPEYWNAKDKTWVSVDPTWGSTTGGIDFFNKLDLRHFAFVIHGTDPVKPYPPGSYKLGPSPQKDVFVNFGRLPENRLPQLEITAKTEPFIPFTHQKVKITVQNVGSSAFYDLPVKIVFDDKIESTEAVEILPPYAGYTFTTLIPFSFLGTKTPNQITVVAGNEEITIKTPKKEIVIYNLVSILAFSLILLFYLLVRLGKIRFEKIKALFTILKRSSKIKE